MDIYRFHIRLIHPRKRSQRKHNLFNSLSAHLHRLHHLGQIGHQVVSIYYHTIMTTVGHISETIEKLNLRHYTKTYGYDTFAKDVSVKTNPEQLMEHLKYMQDQSLEIIESLSAKDLQQAVEPTKVPHPVAKTKFEAIDWNVKHVMWHCGQIASIKRIVDVPPYDYGIKKRV